MLKGKGNYLRELTRTMRFRSVECGTELEGSTPPSVFIGSYNWPKVYAGPMFAHTRGDTAFMDHPERWIPDGTSVGEIIAYRLGLVRGKRPVNVDDTGCRFVEGLRDIAMADSSVDGEAFFRRPPSGASFSDEHLPHGPSGELLSFRADGGRWEPHLERAYYDTDLSAADAVHELYLGGLDFSRVQKAFSAGALGAGRRRRLVPTRWSITACDSTLAGRLLADVRHYEAIDAYRLHEFESLGNRYAVILTPTAWQHEWTEAFLHIVGREELVFSDCESNAGKRGYSSVGGCYYSSKFAVLEALEAMKRQAGAIVLREAYPGYVPLGVFNVRENVRAALRQEPLVCGSLREALDGAQASLNLPIRRFAREGALLREMMTGSQAKLTTYSS